MILFLLMIISTSFPDLSQLKSEQDVNNFVRKYVKDYSTFEVWKEEYYTKDTDPPLYKKQDTDFWKLADFDADGHDDLITLGRLNGSRQVLLFVKIGKEGIMHQEIQPVPMDATLFPEVIEEEDAQVLLVLNISHPANHEITEFKKGNKQQKLEKKILVYKYGGFVEYNHNTPELTIRQLAFKTSRCFGSCPVFQMVIQPSGQVSYNAAMYNNEEGSFNKDLPQEEVQEIFALANYIDIQSLQTRFEVPWTDDQTITTTVTFSDNSEKMIKDYGLKGSYGLQQLYKLVFQLKDGTAWK